MNEKELYRQKYQAQLDEWKADVDRWRAKAKGATADVRLELNRRIDELDTRLVEAGEKLLELSAASEAAWHTLRGGVDTAWETLRKSLKDAREKFKS